MPPSHVVYGKATSAVKPFNRDKCAVAVEFLTCVTATVCDRRNTAAAVEMILAVEMFETTAAVTNETEAKEARSCCFTCLSTLRTSAFKKKMM